MVFFSLDYSFEAHVQACDRIYRIGRSSSCFYVYLVANDSIDGELLKVLQCKQSYRMWFMELSETRLKEKVLAMLKKEFPKAWVYKTSDRWKVRIPDVLVCREGRFFATELKVGKNKPTRLQLYVLKQIHCACGRVAVCRSVDQ
jgi:hypothetical protein